MRHFIASFLSPCKRGTQVTSVADLRADFATALIPAPTLTYHYQTPRLHEGFYRQYRGLQPFIQQCIDTHHPRLIYNVGHSLGGALATIAALDFSMRGIERPGDEVKIMCITFGSPKVGDSVFAHHFNLFMSLGTSFRYSLNCQQADCLIVFIELPIHRTLSRVFPSSMATSNMSMGSITKT